MPACFSSSWCHNIVWNQGSSASSFIHCSYFFQNFGIWGFFWCVSIKNFRNPFLFLQNIPLNFDRDCIQSWGIALGDMDILTILILLIQDPRNIFPCNRVLYVRYWEHWGILIASCCYSISKIVPVACCRTLMDSKRMVRRIWVSLITYESPSSCSPSFFLPSTPSLQKTSVF